MSEKIRFNQVNRDLPRLESRAKVTGSALYTEDFSPPNMAYGLLIHSPYAHARVVSINCEEALNMPGLLAILTAKDFEGIVYNSSGNPPSGLLKKDERVLTDHPLFEGDRVVAVAGETKEICEKAVASIKIQYEVLPDIANVDDALKADAVLLHPEIAKSNSFNVINAVSGDAEQGFDDCDLVVEDTFTVPPINCGCMELTGYLCDYKKEGTLTVTGTTQVPFQDRRLLSEIMGIPEHKIRIIKPVMGGGFGARQQLHQQVVGCFLSKKTKRPIQMILSREEETIATTVRHASKIKMRIGADKNGYIKALDILSYNDAGAYATHSPIVTAAQSKKTPYSIPNYRFEGHSVYTNNLTAGAMRGYGNPQVAFAREILVDRIAKLADIDPMEIRLKNKLSAGDMVPGSTIPVTSCEIEACAKKCAEKADAIESEYQNQGMPKGTWGTAFAMHGSGASNKEGMSSATIRVNDDGTIQLNIGSADIGQGCETSFSQVAAEVLGITLSDITVVAADTKHTTYDNGTFASSQMFVGGNAVLRAAQDVINQVKSGLATVKQTELEKIDFENGLFLIGAEKLTFKQAISILSFGPTGRTISGFASYKAVESPPVFAVCMVRVIKDPVTDVITVTDVVQVVDVGTAINVGIVLGQIHGGVLQGLGYGWMEQMQRDKKTKKAFTADILHYKMATSSDVPRIHGDFVESYEPYGPLGAKSVGELTLVPVAPALANAVAAVTGDEIKSLPLINKYFIEGPSKMYKRGVMGNDKSHI